MKYILLILLLIVSCGKTTKTKVDTPDISQKSDSVIFIKQPEIIEAISFFTSAYQYEVKGNPTIAYSGYIFAHKYDSSSVELMEALMRTAPSDSLKLTWAQKILDEDSTSLNTIRFLGDYHFMNKNSQVAKQYYKKFVSIDNSISDENNYIYYRLGTVYVEEAKLDSAINNFNVLVQQGERFSFVRKNLTLLLAYSADEGTDNNDIIDSLYTVWNDYDKLDRFILFSEYGMHLESIGKDRKAYTIYSTALSFSTTKNDSLTVYKSMSSNAFKLKLFDKMLSSTKKVLEQDSSYTAGINRLAIYYYDQDSMTEARKYLEMSLRTDSTQVLNLYFLGIIDTKDRDYPHARKNFRKAITYDTNYIPAYINLGYLELIEKEYKSADSLLSSVISKDSTIYNSHYFYGLSKLYQKEYPKAVHHIGTALDLAGSDGELYDIKFDYASALEKNEMLDSAVTIFDHIIEKNPTYDPALNYLGYLLIDLDIDVEKGGALIDKALSIDPTNGAYIDSKAWYFYKKGNYEESLTYLLKAYEIIGDDIEILEHLGDVYMKLGNKKEASKYYKQILEIKGKKW